MLCASARKVKLPRVAHVLLRANGNHARGRTEAQRFRKKKTVQLPRAAYILLCANRNHARCRPEALRSSQRVQLHRAKYILLSANRNPARLPTRYSALIGAIHGVAKRRCVSVRTHSYPESRASHWALVGVTHEVAKGRCVSA